MRALVRAITYGLLAANAAAADRDFSRRLHDKVLQQVDANKDERISVDELNKFDEGWLNDRLHSKYLAMGDHNKDGIVDFREFEEATAHLKDET